MSHNFRSRYARKSVKGSIDADFDLVFNKTLSPTNDPFGRRPGPGKDGQNNPKTPLLVTFPPESSNPKRKNFFFDFDYKTCWIRRGFEQLSGSIAWRVIGLQISAKNDPARVLKGLHNNEHQVTQQLSIFLVPIFALKLLWLGEVKGFWMTSSGP